MLDEGTKKEAQQMKAEGGVSVSSNSTRRREKAKSDWREEDCDSHVRSTIPTLSPLPPLPTSQPPRTLPSSPTLQQLLPSSLLLRPDPHSRRLQPRPPPPSLPQTARHFPTRKPTTDPSPLHQPHSTLLPSLTTKRPFSKQLHQPALPLRLLPITQLPSSSASDTTFEGSASTLQSPTCSASTTQRADTRPSCEVREEEELSRRGSLSAAVWEEWRLDCSSRRMIDEVLR